MFQCLQKLRSKLLNMITKIFHFKTTHLKMSPIHHTNLMFFSQMNLKMLENLQILKISILATIFLKGKMG